MSYTHVGWNDTITTQVWLPLTDWNGKFQALGGGGYSSGFGSTYLTYAVANGFATVSTDGGHATGTSTIPTDLTWALASKGNIDWVLLEDYASKATVEMAPIGKQIIESYFDQAANYSYFNGCSGGGRQGLMLAQRYPEAFDGILAISPAINLERFIPAGFWASQVMNQIKSYPHPCEIEAFTKAAIKICDHLDGVKDNIISFPKLCTVNAHAFVGEPYTCNGTERRLSALGAKVVQAAWTGPPGRYGWYGLSKDASLTSYYITTECSSNGTCYASDSDLLDSWITYLVTKEPQFSSKNMTDSTFFDALHYSSVEYASMLGTRDADLSNFKAAGGKMITWHGLADEVIPPEGTTSYYEEVLEQDPRAKDYFRYFEAPGVGHCYGGVGPIPNDAFSQLMQWVEDGIPPDTLEATNGEGGWERPLCPYPSQQQYTGGDPSNASSFSCSEDHQRTMVPLLGDL